MSLTVEKPNQLKKELILVLLKITMQKFKNSDRFVNRKEQCNIKPAYQRQ